MVRWKVGICHRNRLFGECLAAALNGAERLACTLISPDILRLPSPSNTSALADLNLLLLDGSLPADLAGRVAREARSSFPDCKLILLIAGTADERIRTLARQIGCEGALFEQGSLSEVRDAIDDVLEGRQYCSPQLAGAILPRPETIPLKHHRMLTLNRVQLTARESEILTLIEKEDLGNKQIALRLQVSLNTVKNHIHNILEKLEATDRHDAARRARQRQLIRIDPAAVV